MRPVCNEQLTLRIGKQVVQLVVDCGKKTGGGGLSVSYGSNRVLDPSELQKPTSANSAVVRFYRYIQSARDGQELKDCLRIYAACAISTE
ncbi:Protein of unknown function (DUF1676) [Homalodisca vitripennis]|nr:Protein of unknown function (DUF1676) [Homalodisca vitripennis]